MVKRTALEQVLDGARVTPLMTFSGRPGGPMDVVARHQGAETAPEAGMTAPEPSPWNGIVGPSPGGMA